MMIHYSKLKKYDAKLCGKRNIYDNNIYTFDIETTSYLILNGEQLSVSEYEKLDKKEQAECLKYSTMYIWQFSINEDVYYGRTWDEFEEFLSMINEIVPETKYLFIHNLSFEFQYLKDRFHISDVLARNLHKPMLCRLKDYNFVCKCTYMMSNSALEDLPKTFKLDVEKKKGDLDYSLIRHYKTPLSEIELRYCEYDCLVVYKYILKELETYETVKNIPNTNTGKVRRELKELTEKDWAYKNYVRRSINIDPHVYNLLTEAFAGGYTHSNRLFTDEIIENVDSYDEASAYPYFLVTHKFPSTEFRKCNIKRLEHMIDKFAYLLVVKFTNIETKYYNTFISMNKCRNIKGALYDNGRIVKAEEIEIVLTDVDFRLIMDAHHCENYEILESYYSVYKFLPVQLINFILDKYVDKTELKNVEGMEVQYSRTKGMFNSIYGMMVTKNIRSQVSFIDGIKEWAEEELKNDEIEDFLAKDKKDAFLSFSYGCWCTSFNRDALLRRVMALDSYVVYCDTDSCKLRPGYDKNIFEEYNNTVKERIENVSKRLGIDIKRYVPSDIKGIPHMIGIFEKEGKNEHTYERFITQGAKKYAFEEKELDKKTSKMVNKIHITVSGVPKRASVGLKKLEEFRDNYVFRYEDTNKNTLFYSDNQVPFELTDYLGNKVLVTDTSGVCLVPTSYTLGKALDYAYLLTDETTRRSKYIEEEY